jgi:hypothetical protein
VPPEHPGSPGSTVSVVTEYSMMKEETIFCLKAGGPAKAANPTTFISACLGSILILWSTVDIGRKRVRLMDYPEGTELVEQDFKMHLAVKNLKKTSLKKRNATLSTELSAVLLQLKCPL